METPFFFYNDEIFHPSIYTLSPIIGVCLIIWFSNKDELITKILSTKLFIGIGLISYSLYLWHYPVFAFAIKLRITEGNSFINILIGFTIIILSIFSYYFIEKPFRNKKIKFKKIFIILFVKILLILIFSIYTLSLKFHPFVTKYNDENKIFETNYEYNNFDNRKNIFIIGNSYADNLVNVFYRNNELKNDYYFYKVLADDLVSNYQIGCFLDFLEKNKLICDKSVFSFIKTQYEKSDYIIFHERFNYTNTYLSSNFNKVINHLKKDNKKFIVLLDDVRGADILDIYIHRNGDVPHSTNLDKLEKEFFKKVVNFRKKDIEKVKNKFLKDNIKFLTRSELFCDYINQKCPLIKYNDKLYSDYGHITNNGAKYFSLKSKFIIEKLLEEN